MASKAKPANAGLTGGAAPAGVVGEGDIDGEAVARTNSDAAVPADSRKEPKPMLAYGGIILAERLLITLKVSGSHLSPKYLFKTMGIALWPCSLQSHCDEAETLAQYNPSHVRPFISGHPVAKLVHMIYRLNEIAGREP